MPPVPQQLQEQGALLAMSNTSPKILQHHHCYKPIWQNHCRHVQGCLIMICSLCAVTVCAAMHDQEVPPVELYMLTRTDTAVRCSLTAIARASHELYPHRKDSLNAPSSIIWCIRVSFSMWGLQCTEPFRNGPIHICLTAYNIQMAGTHSVWSSMCPCSDALTSLDHVLPRGLYDQKVWLYIVLVHSYGLAVMDLKFCTHQVVAGLSGCCVWDKYICQLINNLCIAIYIAIA